MRGRGFGCYDDECGLGAAYPSFQRLASHPFVGRGAYTPAQVALSWKALQQLRAGIAPNSGQPLGTPGYAPPTIGPLERGFLAGVASGLWSDTESGFHDAAAFLSEQPDWALLDARLLPSVGYGDRVNAGQTPEVDWAKWFQGWKWIGGTGLGQAPITAPSDLDALGDTFANHIKAFIEAQPEPWNPILTATGRKPLYYPGSSLPQGGPIARPASSLPPPPPEPSHKALQVVGEPAGIDLKTLAWRVVDRGDRSKQLLGWGSWSSWKNAFVRRGGDPLVEVYYVADISQEAQNFQGVPGKLAPHLDWPGLKAAIDSASSTPPNGAWQTSLASHVVLPPASATPQTVKEYTDIAVPPPPLGVPPTESQYDQPPPMPSAHVQPIQSPSSLPTFGTNDDDATLSTMPVKPPSGLGTAGLWGIAGLAIAAYFLVKKR